MEDSEGSKEGLVRRVLRRLNPFRDIPGPSDEFQEGIDRSSTSQPDQPSQTQNPQPLTPELQH